MNVQIYIDGRQVLGVLYRTDSDLLIHLPGVLVVVKSPLQATSTRLANCLRQ